MAVLAILTPSYLPDLPHFTELHASVRRYTADDVVHHVLVPNRDFAAFSQIDSPKLRVHPEDENLPSTFISTYGFASLLRHIPRMSKLPRITAVNLARPWPPVRGWILQQILKLDAASRIDADVVLIIDSDVVLIRPIDVSDFLRDGTVRFYRLPGGIGAEMSEHHLWHRTAARLLGLATHESDSVTDYITSFVPWDPRIVRKVQRRVEDTTTSDWQSAVARELRFSEYFLYGVFVDHLGTPEERSFTSSSTLCHSHWGSAPLDKTGADRFLESIGADDVAIHIQSRSDTPADIRRYIVTAAADS
ncbi:DUF6492 family protein [Rhodococcus phenolicus]|uniref:DUF6492 family protein n=1 Tax=Rhodococcus phenolicus TaxID=263849 RepID=UPI00083394A5|nr:DUF6492 family protein [Rhodococcus phenolicus]